VKVMKLSILQSLNIIEGTNKLLTSYRLLGHRVRTKKTLSTKFPTFESKDRHLWF
jgi:hypothetical protein